MIYRLSLFNSYVTFVSNSEVIYICVLPINSTVQYKLHSTYYYPHFQYCHLNSDSMEHGLIIYSHFRIQLITTRRMVFVRVHTFIYLCLVFRWYLILSFFLNMKHTVISFEIMCISSNLFTLFWKNVASFSNFKCVSIYD